MLASETKVQLRSGNEWNAWWAGYDGYWNGKQLAYAMSKIYDNNKTFSTSLGVKNADPNMLVSITGLAIATTDLNRGLEFTSKELRGFRPKVDALTLPANWRYIYGGGLVDIPYDISQWHGYNFTGGVNQFATGGIQSGLPPERGIVLTAAKRFVHHRDKYTPWAQVDVGESGWDANQSSPVNVPDVFPYDKQEVRGAWCVREVCLFDAIGIDKNQFYRFFMGNENDINNSTLFSSMYFAHNYNNDPTTTALEVDGRYLAQLSKHYGDFVYDSTLRESDKRGYRFKKDTTFMYALWKIESSPNQAAWENRTEKAIFVNQTDTFHIPLPTGTQVTIRHLQNFSTTMSATSQTVSGGMLSVPIDLKPVFVEVNGAPVAPNQAPSSNAGSDQSITLPTNTVTLIGGGSDVDGTIASVQWVQLSGPSTGVIVSPNSTTTNVTGLIEGTYVFQLTVTDDDGATAADTVTVVVNPAPGGGYVRTYTNFVRYLFGQLGTLIKVKRKIILP
jgi:hypothetical protein